VFNEALLRVALPNKQIEKAQSLRGHSKQQNQTLPDLKSPDLFTNPDGRVLSTKITMRSDFFLSKSFSVFGRKSISACNLQII
jgi:hypothetical protein